MYILAEEKRSGPISASSIIGKRKKHVVIEISWVKQNEKYINKAVICIATL